MKLDYETEVKELKEAFAKLAEKQLNVVLLGGKVDFRVISHIGKLVLEMNLDGKLSTFPIVNNQEIEHEKFKKNNPDHNFKA